MPYAMRIETHVRTAVENLRRLKRMVKSSNSRTNNLDVDLVVMWGMHRHYNQTAMAEMTGASLSQVKKRQTWLEEHPWAIFSFPVIDRRSKLCVCMFCGMRIPVRQGIRSETKVRIHVAQHVLPREIIAKNGVIGPGELEEGWGI